MSCITQLLEMKGDKPILSIHDEVVIEGGGVYKDYEYLITFVHRGHRCGYVALKDDEKATLENECNADGCGYPDLAVHGGITFFDNKHSAKALLPIPCDDFWVGFDAAHYFDKPDLVLAEKYFGETRHIKHCKEDNDKFGDVYHGNTHRTYEYMEQECRNVIDQLCELR